ncbi:MAG: hypothetical protein NXI10_07795 [bacterium]|nr:hypothetical protein [bacterium]
MSRLILHSLKVIDKNESKDEVYIELNARRILGAYSLGLRDSASLGNYSLEFSGSITLDFWEQDNGKGAMIDSDDKIGVITFNDSRNMSYATARVSGSGAVYEITYSVLLPVYSYSPKIILNLTQICFDVSQYSVLPKTYELQVNATLFGVKGKTLTIKGDYPTNGTFTFQHELFNIEFAFSQVDAALNNSITLQLREHFASYKPSAEILGSYSAHLSKGNDIGHWIFDKVNSSDATDHTKEWTISINIGQSVSIKGRLIFLVPGPLWVNSSQRSKAQTLISEISRLVEDLKVHNQANPKSSNLEIIINNKDVSKQVQHGRNVIVTLEKESGQNKMFKDQDGKMMSREEFVAAIRLGLFPDYHVRNIKGIETPVSNPDRKTNNNLG